MEQVSATKGSLLGLLLRRNLAQQEGLFTTISAALLRFVARAIDSLCRCNAAKN